MKFAAGLALLATSASAFSPFGGVAKKVAAPVAPVSGSGEGTMNYSFAFWNCQTATVI